MKYIYHFQLEHCNYLPLDYKPILSDAKSFKERVLACNDEEQYSATDLESFLRTLKRMQFYELTTILDFFTNPELNEVFIYANSEKQAVIDYNEWLANTSEYWHDTNIEFERVMDED